MFKFEGQEHSDQEMALAYWEKVTQRMEGCKKLATEFFEKYNKPKSYLLEYSTDAGIERIYTTIDEEDCEKIKLEYESIKETVEEEGETMEDEWAADLKSERLPELDIDWNAYIPDCDQHWAGGPAMPLNVDFEDYKVLYSFNLLYYHKQNSDPQHFNLVRDLTNDQFIELLTLRLFDEKLAVNDIEVLDKELYDLITRGVRHPHQQHIIFFSEINDCAETIEKCEEYDALPKFPDNPFIWLITNYIYSHKDEFNGDEQLFKAFMIANEGSFVDR